MFKRELVALVGLPTALGIVIFLPTYFYLALLWVATLLAAQELLAILRRIGHPIPVFPTLAVIAVALPAAWIGGIPWSGAVLTAVVLVTPLFLLLPRYPIQGAAAAMSGAAFTAVFFTATAGAMGLMRTYFPDDIGIRLVLTHCLVIWGGDSGAYYLGSRFGKHRLAPLISPKKSWEGFAGGVFMTFFGVWFCKEVFFPTLGWKAGLGFGLLLCILAPLGDLLESLFKRDSGVKDSSGLIPGHGGFLDRIDSLYYAAPFVLAYFAIVGIEW